MSSRFCEQLYTSGSSSLICAHFFCLLIPSSGVMSKWACNTLTFPAVKCTFTGKKMETLNCCFFLRAHAALCLQLTVWEKLQHVSQFHTHNNWIALTWNLHDSDSGENTDNAPSAARITPVFSHRAWLAYNYMITTYGHMTDNKPIYETKPRRSSYINRRRRCSGRNF